MIKFDPCFKSQVFSKDECRQYAISCLYTEHHSVPGTPFIQISIINYFIFTLCFPQTIASSANKLMSLKLFSKFRI